MTPARFREIRQALGWSVVECAGAIGLSADTVYKMEESARGIHPCTARLMEVLHQFGTADMIDKLRSGLIPHGRRDI